MTKYLFFNIQNGIRYEQLKSSLQFPNDQFGLNNWVLTFPITIYSHDLLSKHIFTESNVTISTNNGTIEDERWKYFAITQNDGHRLYCTSQVFYQKGWLSKSEGPNNNIMNGTGNETQQFYLPKCLIFISNEPYFKTHVNLLKIYRQMRKQRPSISHPTDPKAISRYLNLKAEGRKQQFSLSDSTELNMILDYYLQKCNEHTNGNAILLQKSTNLPILHLYTIESTSLFQFSHFFNLPLSSYTISLVINAILLQKQVIIASKSSNINVMIIESLLQIIRPLKWEHMLVHNLPPHLLDAASENFMPFIAGIHSKYLQNQQFTDKFILIVQQDQFIMPETLPIVGLGLQKFPQHSTPTAPSYLHQKHILQFSIEFMCRLLEPIVKNNKENIHFYGNFYNQFFNTSLCQRFIEKMDKKQLKECVELILINDSRLRTINIQRKLIELAYLYQNPKFIYNETEWIQFYLSRTRSTQKNARKDDETKVLTLKQIKQSIINERGHIKMSRKASTNIRQRSFSANQSRKCKSGQKIKVSVIKHEPYQPFLNQLLDQRLKIPKHP